MGQEIHVEEVAEAGHDEEDAWMKGMREKLVSRSDDGPSHKEHLIYRVHSTLRNQKASCYGPIATSIGPYHYGKEHLLDMETHKKRYFRDLLSRNRDVKFEDLVNKMKNSEDRVRGCYPEKIELESKAFVEMMLFDACFIVELLLKLEYREHGNDDLLVGPSWRRVTLLFRDLLLLENQLPFFLLQEIFKLVMPNETTNHSTLVKFSLNFLEVITPTLTLNEEVHPMDPDSVHHLLHLWHTYLIPSHDKQPQHSTILELKDTAEEHEKLFWMPGVTKLKEAGVKFKVSSNKLLDIKFCNGEMIFPMIYVHEHTETQFRNLMVFEQSCLKSPQFYITCFVSFLDFLINTAKDVEILHHKGVLTHVLGNDEKVARMFNDLNTGLIFTNDNYLYDTFKRVNEYRSRKIPKWRASLVRDYFYSPWAVLSLVAAIVALSLTAIQTTYSVLSSNDYPNQPQ